MRNRGFLPIPDAPLPEWTMTLARLARGGALGLALTASATLGAQVVVIVSAKNPVSKITPDQLSQIFMGQAATFITGGKAEPLDLPEASALRGDFYTKLIGKNPAQVKAHWAKQSFSGKGNPPAVIATPAEMVKKVAEHPKFIGYVDKAAVDASVKVLTVQ